jgi:hypothetical protein
MTHNPSKSKLMCAVAKTSYWSLRITAYSLAGLLLLGLVISSSANIYLLTRNWDWHSVAVIVISSIFIAIAGSAIYILIWLIFSWFDWAKKYREDC